MTKFADQLYADLIQEHGPALARTKPPAASPRPITSHRALLATGAGGLAVAATVGALVAGGGTPAYALTTGSDGTVTLAVYQAGARRVTAGPPQRAGVGESAGRLRHGERAGCPGRGHRRGGGADHRARQCDGHEADLASRAGLREPARGARQRSRLATGAWPRPGSGPVPQQLSDQTGAAQPLTVAPWAGSRPGR